MAMNYTRAVDDLGRIVIPKEIRKHLGIEAGTECKVTLVGNRVIVANANDVCAICGKPADIKVTENHSVCTKCANIIKKGVEEK